MDNVPDNLYILDIVSAYMYDQDNVPDNLYILYIVCVHIYRLDNVPDKICYKTCICRSWCFTVYLRIVNAQAIYASKKENQGDFKYLVRDFDAMTEVQQRDACQTKALEMRQRCLMVVTEMQNSGFNTELHKDKSAQQAQKKKDKKNFEGWELPDPLTVLPG